MKVIRRGKAFGKDRRRKRFLFHQIKFNEIIMGTRFLELV
jgi:hypothetical protein